MKGEAEKYTEEESAGRAAVWRGGRSDRDVSWETQESGTRTFPTPQRVSMSAVTLPTPPTPMTTTLHLRISSYRSTMPIR